MCFREDTISQDSGHAKPGGSLKAFPVLCRNSNWPEPGEGGDDPGLIRAPAGSALLVLIQQDTLPPQCKWVYI